MRFRLLRPHALRIGGVPQFCPAGMVVELPPHSRVTPFIEPLDEEAADALETAKWLILETTTDSEIPGIGSRQTLE